MFSCSHSQFLRQGSKASSVVSLQIYVHLLGLPVKVKRQSTGQLEFPLLSKFAPKEPLLTSHSRFQSNTLTILAVESTATFDAFDCVSESHPRCHGYDSAGFVGPDPTGVSVLTVLPWLPFCRGYHSAVVTILQCLPFCCGYHIPWFVSDVTRGSFPSYGASAVTRLLW
jgi:hypothetical protein